MLKAYGEPALCHLRKLSNSAVTIIEKSTTNQARLLVDSKPAKELLQRAAGVT